MILDSFKSLLKQPAWSLMLILLGVDSLVRVSHSRMRRFLPMRRPFGSEQASAAL